MKLRQIVIERLAGIDLPFAIKTIGDGIQIVLGPNGIGKSSVCRALRALFFGSSEAQGFIAASAGFVLDGDDVPWRVEREGTRHRWLRAGSPHPAPPLPAAHLDGCYFLLLRDLLEASDTAGADLAQQIRRQMSGGYDLERVARRCFAPKGKRALHNVGKELDQADQEVQRTRARQAELARSEGRLVALEGRLEAAEAASQRLGLFGLAFETLALEERLRAVRAELAALPAVTETLRGDELAAVEQRVQERENKVRQIRDADTLIEALDREVRATRLEEALDPAALAAWRARADKLATLENQRDAARLAWRECQAGFAEAARPLSIAHNDPPAIGVAGAAELFAFLRRATRADDGERAIDERLATLSRLTDGEQVSPSLALLERAAASLRAWLRARDPDDTAARRVVAMRLRLGLIGVILAAAAAALAIAGLLDWIPARIVAWSRSGLAGGALGLLSALWLLRTPAPSDGGRQCAERDFPRDLEPPASWNDAAVLERLHAVEADVAARRVRAERRQDRDREVAGLESRRMVLARERSALAVERQGLAERLGLELLPDDAELVDTARALDTLRLARQAASSAQERLHGLDADHRSLLAELAAELGRWGEDEPQDAAAARAALDQLIARNNRLRTAQQRARDAQRGRRVNVAELGEINAKIASLYRKAGLEPEDRAALVRLIERIEPAKKLRQAHDSFVLGITRARDKLEQADALALLQLDAAQLGAEKTRLAALAARGAALTEEIADIRAEVKQAREGHGLEDALARRDACRQRLAEQREREFYAMAGRFWIAKVKAEHETTQMPRVLKRAHELFARFTEHAYDLRVAPDASGSFIAIEADSGAARRLGELSDGTRVQLLLATRLAFAEQVEHGVRLPLFLDEALDQADPARFRAMAASLGRMAAEDGRQIFYLTHDPSDVLRLERVLVREGMAPPGVIDLGAIRRRASSVAGAEALRVAELSKVPAPSGHSAEAYGALLGVSPLEPRRGPDAQHLFHLTWDALPLLHRLLAAGIRTVGQWRTLVQAGGSVAAEIEASADVAAQLSDRAALLETFCHAWREGRGKAVDRKAIERSQAISDRYLDAVAAVAAELGGSATLLLEALRARGDARLRGFRTKAAEDLESFLSEASFLDPRPVLGEADITARMASTPAASRLPQQMAAVCSHRWWRLAERSAAANERGTLASVPRPASADDAVARNV